MTTYAPFDQSDHLGPPPWSGPEVDAWEKAHGHDVRLKCYPEYGCQAIVMEADRLRVENERLRKTLGVIAGRRCLPGTCYPERCSPCLARAALAQS